MRFDLDDDARALQGGVRELCRGDEAPDHPKARSAPGGVLRDNWRALGDHGVFSLRVPEAGGGVGLGLAQAVLAFEELGRANVPGPLVATHLGAGVVDGAAAGEAVVGLVERTTPPVVVEHLEALDRLVVVDDNGLWAVDPADVEGALVEDPLDPLTPLHVVQDLPQGDLAGGADVASRWRLEGALLTASMLVGLAAAATEAAVAYAKEREQFGRPIGSFQAVKHLCADMLVRAEVARVAVHAAAVLADGAGGGDAVRPVAGAWLLASEAAFDNGKDCIQVHGGMGFTWEAGVHLYVKRAAVLRTHFGGDAVHTDLLASGL